MKHQKIRRCIYLISIIVICMLISACSSDKGDLKITFIDKENSLILNTQITVGGIDSTDIAEIYSTDERGEITLTNIGTGQLTFSIVSEEGSFVEDYNITSDDLQTGRITIQFYKFLYNVI